MCDICDFVHEEAGKHDEHELGDLLDEIARDEGKPAEDLYVNLIKACAVRDKSDEPGLNREALSRFVRLVQIVWERHGLGAELYQFGVRMGRMEAAGIVAPADPDTLH